MIKKTQKFLSEINKSDIPKGMYCYSILKIKKNKKCPIIKTKTCPYWKSINKQQNQNDGYCRLLQVGDWQEGGTDLLWDQIKECGINE